MLDRVEALERLARLHASGALSDDEFSFEKKRILEGPVDSAAPALSLAKPGAEVASPAAEPPPAALPDQAMPGWRIWLARHRWIVGGLAAALAIGAVAAWAILLDLNDAAAPSARRQKAQEKAQASRGKAPAAAAEAGADGPSLAALLQFDDPARCGAGTNLRNLIQALAARQPGSGAGAAIDIAGAGEPVVPRVERVAVEGAQSAPVVAQVDLAGTWHGLSVRGVRTVTWPGSRASSLQIRFGDMPERVRQSLNEQGFNLSAVGALRNAQGDGDQPVALGVEAISDGAALTCIRGTSAAPAPAAG